VLSVLALFFVGLSSTQVASQRGSAAKTLTEAKKRFEDARSSRDRVTAINAMGRFKNSQCRQYLLNLLKKDRPSSERIAIYRQLGYHAHGSVIKKLAKELATRDNSRELSTIAQSLGSHGKKGQAVLLKALRSKRPLEQNAAIEGLSDLTDNKSVVDALIKAFGSGSSASKIEILKALRGLKNKTQLARICLQAATDSDKLVRGEGFRRMHDCSGDKILAALQQAFTSTKDSSTLYDVAHGLAGQGKEGVEVLVQGLGSKNSAVRRAAVNADILRALIAAFETAPADAQEGILRAMSGYKHSRALADARLAALKAKSPGTRAEALLQLANAGHSITREAALKLAKDPAIRKNTRDKGRVVYALGKVLDRELLPLFLEIAAEPDWSITNYVRMLLSDKKSPVLSLLRTDGLKREDDNERITVVLLLAAIETKETSKLLILALRDKSPQLLGVATRALVKRKDRRVIPFLKDSLDHSNVDVQLQAMLSLHKFQKLQGSWPKQVFKIMRENDGAIRFLALDLLAELRYRPALTTAHTMMNSDAWQVRSVVYYFCRRVRDLSSISLIIARLPSEKGRLQAEAMTTLRSLTLMTYREPGHWKQWWDSVGANFKLPPAPAENDTARGAGASMTYYSIPLTSKAVCFLIDTSGSMSAKVGTAKITRLQAAKDALKYVIENCAPDFYFNLIPFSGTGRAWKVGLTPASGENKLAAQKFVKRFRPSGGTNVHDALKQAFADKKVDTIYLLSDGQPSTGNITDENDLADEVQLWNMKRRIVINTISIGTDSVLMQRLAKESGGTFVRRL